MSTTSGGIGDSDLLPDTLLLVPNSGIQFVEYPFNADAVPKLNRSFVEREFPKEIDQATGKMRVRLLQAWDDADPEREPTVSPKGADREYKWTGSEKTLEPFLNKWIPVPYLAANGETDADRSPKCDPGPTNWVRVRVVQEPVDSPSGYTHRAIFAFDTAIVDDAEAFSESAEEELNERGTFTTPTTKDVERGFPFVFISQHSKLVRFVNDPAPPPIVHDYGEWVVRWADKVYREFRAATRRRRTEEDFGKFEALAHYFFFLETLNAAVSPRRMKFTPPSSNRRPIEVDLVLDVGNSRTFGILIERMPNRDRRDLKDSYTLELRDLQRPERHYHGSFESHIEFFAASFGDEALSRLAGGGTAFYWPSAVRVGPEANTIRQRQEGTEGDSGLSSPKRYLWDLSPVEQAWEFPKEQYIEGRLPPVGAALVRLLNARGDSLNHMQRDRNEYRRAYSPERLDEDEANEFTFSRSSLYAMMISEILAHALVMINSPVGRLGRSSAEIPRRLSRIILTLPTATPVREQLLMRLRAKQGIQLLWDHMNWPDDETMPQPKVQTLWDEASCVQFVWLYGEIVGKTGGRIEEFFDLAGRPRKRLGPEDPPNDAKPDERSLRVATIDIGGGTTDLMITTYYVDGGQAIVPVQNFREGIRIAGDDILRTVVETIVLPAVERAIGAAGVRRPAELLSKLFGGNDTNQTAQAHHLRRQFVLRVLNPVGYGLLKELEDADLSTAVPRRTRTLGSFLGVADGGTDAELGIPERILNYVKSAAPECRTLSLASVSIPVDLNAISNAAYSVLDNVFDNLGEALYRFDCDVVLLSGRPTRLPVISQMLIDRLAVSPDKVVRMHLYQPGRWYPLLDHANDDRIGDPKTTTAVGAMLCALSERDLPNFMIFTSKLRMRSIANYVGRLAPDGPLRAEGVMFETAQPDLDPEELKTLEYHVPMSLGYRQLPSEKWIASPLYYVVRTGTKDVALPLRIPLQLKIEKPEDEDTQDQLLNIEATKEELVIGDEILDADDGPVSRRDVRLVFRTLSDDHGYWLDTGIIRTR